MKLSTTQRLILADCCDGQVYIPDRRELRSVRILRHRGLLEEVQPPKGTVYIPSAVRITDRGRQALGLEPLMRRAPPVLRLIAGGRA